MQLTTEQKYGYIIDPPDAKEGDECYNFGYFTECSRHAYGICNGVVVRRKIEIPAGYRLMELDEIPVIGCKTFSFEGLWIPCGIFDKTISKSMEGYCKGIRAIICPLVQYPRYFKNVHGSLFRANSESDRGVCWCDNKWVPQITGPSLIYHMEIQIKTEHVKEITAQEAELITNPPKIKETLSQITVQTKDGNKVGVSVIKDGYKVELTSYEGHSSIVTTVNMRTAAMDVLIDCVQKIKNSVSKKEQIAAEIWKEQNLRGSLSQIEIANCIDRVTVEIRAIEEEKLFGPKNRIICPDCAAFLKVKQLENGRFEVEFEKHAS